MREPTKRIKTTAKAGIRMIKTETMIETETATGIGVDETAEMTEEIDGGTTTEAGGTTETGIEIETETEIGTGIGTGGGVTEIMIETEIGTETGTGIGIGSAIMIETRIEIGEGTKTAVCIQLLIL